MSLHVPFLDLAAMHAQVRPELDRVWDEVVGASAFIGGAHVERFEREWADYCATTHAVGVANGTDALLLVLRGLGIGEGDEVLVPANTFVATVEAVVLAGATPRFVDVDPDTMLMTAAHVEAALTERTAAVMAVHLYGQMPDMDALLAVTSKAGVALIEDAAQAHGATWRGRPAGSWGAAGCFSFYPGKNLGAFGDGGAVVTNDDALERRLRSLCDHGRRTRSKYVHDVVGVNSRLDGLQAGILSVKLTRLDGWNAARRDAMALYAEELAGSGIQLVKVAEGAVSVHHLAIALVDHREQVQARLQERGIATGVHYPIPCHQQAAYSRWATDSLPVSEQTAPRLLSLPLFPTITVDQVRAVCTALREVTADLQREGVQRAG